MEVIYGDAKVRLWERSSGRWALKWREAGQSKATTFTGNAKKAEAKARTIARRVDKAIGGRVITAAEGEAMERLRAAAAPRSLIAALDDATHALSLLNGRKSLEDAARSIASTDDSAPFLPAMEKFMAGYDDSPARTRAGLRIELQAFEDSYPGILLGEVDDELLRNWLKRNNPSEITFNNRLTTWRNFFSRCRDWQMLPQNQLHVAELIKKKTAPAKSPEVFTIEEATAAVKILREEKDYRLLTFFALGCWAGLRPSEITRLEWTAIDFSENYIHVSSRVAQKLSQERWIPIQDNLASILQECMEKHQSSTSRSRKSPKVAVNLTARKLTSTLIDKKVIKQWTPDLARHSFVTYRLAQLQQVGVVAEEAGNSEATIRKHYRRPVKATLGEKWFKIT